MTITDEAYDRGFAEGQAAEAHTAASESALSDLLCAPTNNGIPDLDAICERYNKGEIDINQLVCTVWNKALSLG